GELAVRGEGAVPQQVGDLFEALVLGEPLRVVAPVHETAVLAVHERDLGTPERHALETRPGQVDPVGAYVGHGRKSRADPALPCPLCALVCRSFSPSSRRSRSGSPTHLPRHAPTATLRATCCS